MIKQFHKKISILIILIIVFMFLFQNAVNCENTSDVESEETIENTETDEENDEYVDYADDTEYLDDNEDYSEAIEEELEEDSTSDDSESNESDSTSETTTTTSTSTSSNTNGNEAIIEKAQEIIEVMAAGNWRYEHGVSGRKTWEDAKTRKTSSCATFVTWVLQETGYLTKGKIISHKKYGTAFSTVKNAYNSNLTNATWYDLTGSTVKTSSYDDLLPGDVVIVEKKGSWRSIAIYAGKNSSGKNLYYSAASGGKSRNRWSSWNGIC